MSVPNPRSRLKNADESINSEMITKNLNEEKQRRLKLGDDDLLEVRNQTKYISFNKACDCLRFFSFGQLSL